ncbi:MAG: hypothetical protein HQL51_09865 [Magnetococcales bacterium]|nr:hypothetical protein [Magnetococcales bacterium]
MTAPLTALGQWFGRLVDNLSWGLLLPMALLLGLAPFQPMPHLQEKILMLLDGTLRRPLDIFDLCLHSAPILLIVLKWRRQTSGTDAGGGSAHDAGKDAGKDGG